jgi:hypothetical protein
MQNAHWKPCSSTTPCCTGDSVPSALASPSIVVIFLPAHRVRQHRARVVRHIVHQHRARAALGAVAADLGARQSRACSAASAPASPASSRRRGAPGRSPSTSPAVRRCPAPRRCLAERVGPEQIARRRHRGAGRNHALMKLRRVKFFDVSSVILLSSIAGSPLSAHKNARA